MTLHVATLAIGTSVLVVQQGGGQMIVTTFDNGLAAVWDSPLVPGTAPEQTLAWALELAMGLGARGAVTLLHQGYIPAAAIPTICIGADAVHQAKSGAPVQ